MTNAELMLCDSGKHPMVLRRHDCPYCENERLQVEINRMRIALRAIKDCTDAGCLYESEAVHMVAVEGLTDQPSVQPDALRMPTCQLAHDFDERGFCRFCGINQHLLGVPLNAGPPSNSPEQRK